MSQSRSGTVINNTLFLYIRSFLTMLIGIYTSRVLLVTLGIDDYGIYNLVAGIVAMFASLKGVFASSVQRFLNYAKGKKDEEQVSMIFNLSMLIHIGLAALFGIVVEIIGVWFVLEKLNIPSESIDVALFVFHCAVLTTVITIASIPFDAVVIANERFKYYAWITLIDSVLKLVIVYLLVAMPYQYLCSYALLLLIIGMFNLSVNIFYCRRFRECKIHFVWDKALFKKLASFSAWNFLGNTAFSLVNEGLNMILNIFGGVAVNAGRGIAYQVKNAVQTLCGNIFVAVQPVIIQQAASKEKEIIFSNIFRLSRLNFYISAITVIPIFVFAEYILNLWLGQIPPMSVWFVKLLMMYIVIRSLHSPIDLLFKAYGRIKKYQLVDSVTLVLSLPISYILLRIGVPLYCVFVIMSIVEIVNLSSIVVCAKYELGLNTVSYFKNVGITCVFGFIILFSFAYLFSSFVYVDSLIAFIMYLMLVLLISISVSVLLLGREDRMLVVTFIKNKIKNENIILYSWYNRWRR